MTAEQFGGITRAILSAIGGYIVGRGLIDQATMLTVVGALVTLATAAWSVYSKKPAAPAA